MTKRRTKTKKSAQELGLEGVHAGMSFFKEKPVKVHLHVEADSLHDAARQLKHHMGQLGVKRGRKPGPKSIAEALSE